MFYKNPALLLPEEFPCVAPAKRILCKNIYRNRIKFEEPEKKPFVLFLFLGLKQL